MTPPSIPENEVRAPGAHVDEDTCLDLLHGLLPPERRDRVVAHVKSCAECERLLRTRAAQRERYRARETLGALAELDAKRGGRAAGIRSRAVDRTGPWARLRRFVAAPILIPAAAAIVATIVVLYSRSRPSPELLAPRWLPPASRMMEPRVGSPPEERELALGLAAYARHDLADAIAYLEAARPTDWQMDRMRTVYLASALQAHGESRKAAATLDTLRMDDLPDPWGGEARWTYWLALRGSAQQARADSLLGELAHEPGEIGERARAARR